MKGWPRGWYREISLHGPSGEPLESIVCPKETCQIAPSATPAPPESLSVVDKAIAYVRGEYGATTHAGLQIDARVLADEVERLREDFSRASDQADELYLEVEKLRKKLKEREDYIKYFSKVSSDTAAENVRLSDERAQLVAAIPDIIGCSLGRDKALQCQIDNYGWSPCCRARLKCVELGLIDGEVKQ
jgi:hypothetical protein